MLLGDVALAHGVCAREAETKGIALETHAAARSLRKLAKMQPIPGLAPA
ncbi:MAG: hypothetical protein RIB52_07005 [Erythrobacter sp.]